VAGAKAQGGTVADGIREVEESSWREQPAFEERTGMSEQEKQSSREYLAILRAIDRSDLQKRWTRIQKRGRKGKAGSKHTT
jgi:hypothetical protein